MTTHVAYHQALAAAPLRVVLCVVCCISFCQWWYFRTRGCHWTGRTDEAWVACGTSLWARLHQQEHVRESRAALPIHRSNSRPFVSDAHSPRYSLRIYGNDVRENVIKEIETFREQYLKLIIGEHALVKEFQLSNTAEIEA